MGNSSRLPNLLVLGIVSVVCFCLAALIFTRLISESADPLTESPQTAAKNIDLVFPDSVQIGREGHYLEVPHSASLLPVKQADYLLFFWFNLRNIPKAGERLVLISKYSGTPPKIKGYAVGLSRDSNSIRPVLFWGDGSSAGRWYDFPEIPVVRNEWNLLALHVHKERFVGMYSARITAGAAAVKFLGGYEITLENPLDLGDSSIIWGAPPGRDFRGRIGPLGIISPLALKAEDLQSALQGYVKSPLDFKRLSPKSAFELLISDGRIDQSQRMNKVVTTY